ncbi:hypothetical protein [Eubacterium oxidoreducens]|uniref:hypothetical protein n=1 Tax=Eubacterium oxidoreducens TaxID=1732 RepID=UPI00159FA78A|nr:hypothetical protein [Eubacterium oxidoreducens]
MRTDSGRNLSAEADPNPARKTRERVLTKLSIAKCIAQMMVLMLIKEVEGYGF